MKHLSTLKSLLLVLFAVLGGVNVAGADMFVIDFENDATTYSDWTFNNMTSQQTGSITAHGGINYGTTGGKATASITTKEPISNPVSITFYVSKQSSNTTSSSWKIQVSSNNSTWEDVMTQSATSMTKGSWVKVTQDLTSYNDVYIRVYYTGSTAIRNIDDVSLVYEASDPNKPAAPTFSLAEGTYWSVQSLVLSTTVEGGGICYTIDGTDPTKSETSMVYSTAISLSTTTTVNACVVDADGNFSNVVSRTYTFVPSIANTEETALTTTEAIALIDKTSAEQLAAEDQKVYVKGTVSKVDSYNSKYKSITYWLDGDAFEVYSGKGLDNADFSAETDVEVGAEVIVYGNIKKYNSTYGFEAGNYLVSYVFDKTLESVAISGSATKTSYEEGETFDFSGLTLTATYDKGSTMDITSSATWTASPETLTLGTTEVTVTATYNEKTATATIPVNVTKAFPTVTLDLSTDKTTTATTEKIEWVRDEFTINSVKVGKTAANNYYGGDTNKRTSTRFYTDNSFNVVPAPFVSIKKITYEATSTGYATALATSTWTNATASADNTTVTIVPEDGTKTITAKIGATTGATSIVVTYEVVDNADITLVAQDGTDYYATFSSKKAVEFVDAEVYAVDVVGTKLVLNEVTSKQVPANTGVLIKTASTQALYTYIDAADDLENNLLRASSVEMEGSGYKFYKLAYGNWANKTGLGFYWGAEDGAAFTAKAGGAYLAVPTGESARVKGFAFGADEETAIESVEAEAANEEIFDLSGRKVSKAVKGLYIINGKKVVK